MGVVGRGRPRNGKDRGDTARIMQPDETVKK